MTRPSARPKVPGFGIANYRSFDETGFHVADVRKVNVFIGKNNCGKSNVLRALELLRRQSESRPAGAEMNKLSDNHRRSNHSPVFSLEIPTSEVFQGGGNPHEFTPQWQQLLGDTIRVRWSSSNDCTVDPDKFSSLTPYQISQLTRILTGRQWHSVQRHEVYLPHVAKAAFGQGLVEIERSLKGMLTIPVFRQIDAAAELDGETFSGRGVVRKLRTMQNPRLGNEADRNKFEAVRRFAADLLGVPGLRLEVPAEEDRIYLEMHGVRHDLENYGTGVHHLLILGAALAMFDGRVVAIEEPEVHLHPELQRKLLRFMEEQTNNTYFVTTHSNAFLDASDEVNVYHVRHDGLATRVEHAAAPPAARRVLNDMGYKASDILQANGVVWVEGPSDRVYLNRWLHLAAPDLAEGVHYAVAFYGGALLAHHSADDSSSDFVQVLRINRNAFVLMDRDGDSASAPLAPRKGRMIADLGAERVWVTAGREVENYLSAPLVARVLGGEWPGGGSPSWGDDDRVGDAVAAATGRPFDKVDASRRLAAAMTDDDLSALDLRDRVQSLVQTIREWNLSDRTSAGAAPARP